MANMDYRQRPRVRFGAIGEAWGLFKNEWVTWMVTSIVVLMAYSVIGGLLAPLLPRRARFGPEDIPFLLTKAPTFVVGLFAALLMGFLYGGMFRIACMQVRGRRISVTDLFGVTSVAGPLAIGSMLYFVIFSVCAGCCFVPGLIAGGGLMFTLPLIVEGRLSGIQALQASWDAFKGQLFAATFFHTVLYLVHGMGWILCGVGILFTLPLYPLAIAVLYRDFFPEQPGFAKKPTFADPDF